MLKESYNSAYTRSLIRNKKKPYKKHLYDCIRESWEYRLEDLKGMIPTCKELDEIFNIKTVQFEKNAYRKLQLEINSKLRSN